MDGTIERRAGGNGGRIRGSIEEEETTCAGTGFWFRQVGGITVGTEDHLAGMITDGGVGLCVRVVKYLLGCQLGGFGGLGLGNSKGSQGNKHGGINRASIIQEDTDDFLEPFDARGS